MSSCSAQAAAPNAVDTKLARAFDFTYGTPLVHRTLTCEGGHRLIWFRSLAASPNWTFQDANWANFIQ
eukprot:4306051-Amphidinium_carterae.1